MLFRSLTGQWYRNKSDFNLVFGSTANRLIEFDEKVSIPSLSMLLLNGLIQGKWTYKWNPKTKLMTGFQSMLQQNGNESNASDTLIPNAMVFDAGVYSSFIAERGNWNFQAGIRYDFRKLMAEFQGEKTLDFHGLNGAMGAVLSNGDFTFRTNVSSGFRAPHLTELFSNGYHHGALRYELGRIDLKPEKATQLDLTLEWSGDHSAVMLNPFGNFIRDYIFLQPMDTLMDGIPAFSYDQKRQVLFYGVDAGYHFHPHFAHGLHWEISASYIAVWTTGDSSVSLIPQPRLMNTLRYELNLGKKIQVKEMQIGRAHV